MFTLNPEIINKIPKHGDAIASFCANVVVRGEKEVDDYRQHVLA